MRAFKFEFAPALGLAGPKEGFAADLVTADPVEGFLLDIGVEFIVDKKMLGGFTKGVSAADDRVVGEGSEGFGAAVGKVPGVFCGGGIVLEMFYGSAALQQEGGEALFAELFCGPAAADAGADDDCIVLVHVMNLVKMG